MMGLVASSAITKFLKDLEDEITISDNLSEFISSTNPQSLKTKVSFYPLDITKKRYKLSNH